KTFEPLVKQFNAEKDPETKADIIRAVAGLQTADNPFLVNVLLDRMNPEVVRREAVAGLEKVKTTAAQEALAKVAVPAEPVGLQVRAIEALGLTKGKAAPAVCREALASKEPVLRQAAAATLGKLGDAAVATELLAPRLDDADLTVRIAAI